MRIGVDATSWGNRRGYGRFARNAIDRLVKLDPETTYVLVIDEASARGAELPGETLIVSLSRPPAEAASADSYRSPADLLRLGAAVTRARFDAFLFPSIYTYFPSAAVPTVVGVHDLIADDFPELTVPGRRARTFWQIKQRLAIRLARRLFTVSESSRREIATRLRVPLEKLAVVPEAPDPVFHPRSSKEIERETRAIGVEPGERYLLFAGGISPHKNVETLVAGFARLQRDRLRLVLVGALDDTYLSSAAVVRAQIEELGLTDRVLLPGYVSDETLACLYGGAAAVVLPSLAEGFGLPAVEAAACGAPIVLSDIPPHRETLGDDALFFPPHDADALAEQVGKLLDSETVSRSLAERGRERVARYSWDAAAEALRALVHEAAR
ncbi:MAG TPA: glycosyltransferase family 1 protein [Gaiellaceae bacterium]|nr:glycosyltransferase family 1 protein [Gaiellaceae bacterium]